MGLVSLLFSFKGRINRKQYWLGSTMLGFVNFLANMMSSMLTFSATMEKAPADRIAAMASQSVVTLPLFALVFWCSLAVQVKRFHDRGRSGWFSVAPLVAITLLVVSIVGSAFANAPLSTMINEAAPYFWLLMLICVAFFIDLGCLPSVEGPNKFGDPPSMGGRAPSPTPQAPRASDGAMPGFLAGSSLSGAASAIDRAIAEGPRTMTPSPVPAAPAMARAAAPASASFGRAPAGGGFGKKR